MNSNSIKLCLCFKQHIKAEKLNKASGPDKISGKELLMLVGVFIDRFHRVVMKSLAISKFPVQWKTAKVN